LVTLRTVANDTQLPYGSETPALVEPTGFNSSTSLNKTLFYTIKTGSAALRGLLGVQPVGGFSKHFIGPMIS